MNTEAEAIGNKRRHYIKEALAAVEFDAAVPKLERKRIEVIVTQHDALGCAGRTAGMYDHAAFVRAIRDRA